MSKYLLFFSIIFLSFSNKTFSQNELGLHFMDLMQSTKTNPAWIGEERIQIGLPNLHLNYYNTAGNFNGLVVDYIGGISGLNFEQALNDLSVTGNILRGGIELGTIDIGYRLGNLRLGLSHAQKVDVFADYPQTLAKLFLEGNGQYVGETIELNNNVNLTAYNEFALSGAIELGNLIVGGKVKYLTGIANASVGKNALKLFTDDDVYQLTLISDYELNTSTIATSTDLSTFRLDFGNFSASDLFTKNNGIAFDLGVTYQVNDDLKVAASIIDLGKINWTENVNNYSSQGTSTYEGFEFTQFSADGEISFSNALDTLEEVFNFVQTKNKYSTTLPTKLYLSANYQLNEMWQIGGLIFAERYRDQTFSSFALSGRAQITESLSLGGIYSARKDSFFNLGLNFAVKLGPVQLYGITDNFISVFDPYNGSNVNLRTGLNLLF